MATNQVMKHCKVCGKTTLHIQPSTSHVLHLLLTLITVGLWLFVWILIALTRPNRAQCTECGQQKGILG